MSLLSSPDALYLFGLFYKEKPDLEGAPPGFAPPGELRINALDGTPFFACTEPTYLDLWTGPEAESRLQDIQWVGPRALVHEEVQRWCYSINATYYPTSLGTIFSTLEALTSSIVPRTSELEEYFIRTGGAFQFTLKGYFLAPKEEKKTANFQSGSDYLRHRAQRKQEGSTLPLERLRKESALLLSSLQPHFREFAQGQPASRKVEGKELILQWHLLIDEDKIPDFQSALKEILPQLSDFLELELLGPLPPYHFR